MLLFICILFIVGPIVAQAACANPEISTVTSFTTRDATIVNQIAILGEFTVKCGNGESPQLFAEYEGKVTPVARVGDNSYQLSWSKEVKAARSGDTLVRLFDEEGFANIRKAQRAGDDLSTVPSLGVITVNHPGSYKGPWINSELLASLIAVIASYFALTTKSKLLS